MTDMSAQLLQGLSTCHVPSFMQPADAAQSQRFAKASCSTTALAAVLRLEDLIVVAIAKLLVNSL